MPSGSHLFQARDHGLPVSLRGLEGLLKRLDPSDPNYDGGVDQRGRYARDKVYDPDAWEHFKVLSLSDRGLTEAESFRQTAIEAKRRRRVPADQRSCLGRG